MEPGFQDPLLRPQAGVLRAILTDVELYKNQNASPSIRLDKCPDNIHAPRTRPSALPQCHQN